MLSFQPITIEDRSLFEEKYAGRIHTSYDSFSNLIMWQKEDRLSYTVMEGFLCIVGVNSVSGNRFAYFPVGGKADRLKTVVDALLSEFPGLVFTYLKKSDVENLRALYGESIRVNEERDLAEYRYDAEKLRLLSGKALHAKRNHVNKFHSLYPDSHMELIARSDKDALWRAIEALRRDPVLSEEEKNMVIDDDYAIDTLYRNFEKLPLTGAILYAGDEIAAYTIGERINGDTALIHVEKAHRDIEGAYSVINQSFLNLAFPDVSYVNREEDMGNEGLRQAKTSYCPLPFDPIYTAYIAKS